MKTVKKLLNYAVVVSILLPGCFTLATAQTTQDQMVVGEPARVFAPESAGRVTTNVTFLAQEKLVAAADRLQEAVRGATKPGVDDGFSAIELDPEANAVRVYWKQGKRAPDALQQLADLITGEGVTVTIHNAPFSHADLIAEANRLLDEAGPRSISEVSIRPMSSGLAVELNGETDMRPAQQALSRLQSRLRARRAAAAPETAAIIQTTGHPKRLFSRHNDSSPWKGGAEIAIGGVGCSTGFAVGSWFGRYVLTAGHCSFYTDNSLVFNGSGVLMGVTEGSHATELDYQDSMLVKLSSWADLGRIYDGGVDTGEFTKPVKKPIGSYVNQYLCTSGAFSGARCDIKVESTTIWFYDFIGRKFGPEVKARQIEGQAAAGAGDSGGPVFALDAQSNVLATGIINGGDTDSVPCTGVLYDSRYGNRQCSSVVYYTPIWSLLDQHGVWLETN